MPPRAGRRGSVALSALDGPVGKPLQSVLSSVNPPSESTAIEVCPYEYDNSSITGVRTLRATLSATGTGVCVNALVGAPAAGLVEGVALVYASALDYLVHLF